MQLLDAGQQLATRPSPNPSLSPGWANNAPATSPPTIADPDSWNAIMAELIQFLTMTGQSASKTNTTQVAVAALMLFGAYGIDSGGTANEYVITPAVALPALLDGMPVWLWTTRPATGGAATLQLGSLAAEPIAGTVSAGLNQFFWNAGLSQFVAAKSPAVGQCQLSYTSATAIGLARRGGDRVSIDGVQYPLPSGGIAAGTTGVYVNGTAAQNLAASTVYYVSLAVVAEVLTLRFWAASSYGHMPDTTAGNGGTEVIESGGTPIPGDTLVGMVMTNASTQFSPALTRSWFNRQAAEIAGSAVVASTSSTTFVDLGASFAPGWPGVGRRGRGFLG